MNRLPAVLDGSGRSSDMKVSPAAAATPVPSWTASASASRSGNAGGSKALSGQNGQSVSGKESAWMRAFEGTASVRAGVRVSQCENEQV